MGPRPYSSMLTTRPAPRPTTVPMRRTFSCTFSSSWGAPTLELRRARGVTGPGYGERTRLINDDLSARATWKDTTGAAVVVRWREGRDERKEWRERLGREEGGVGRRLGDQSDSWEYVEAIDAEMIGRLKALVRGRFSSSPSRCIEWSAEGEVEAGEEGKDDRDAEDERE